MSLLRQLLDADGKSMADVRASIQHLAGTSSLKLPFFRRSWGVQLVGLGTRYETLILWPVSQHTRQTGPISLTAIVDRGQRDSQAASCFGGPFGTFLCQRTFDLRWFTFSCNWGYSRWHCNVAWQPSRSWPAKSPTHDISFSCDKVPLGSIGWFRCFSTFAWKGWRRHGWRPIFVNALAVVPTQNLQVWVVLEVPHVSCGSWWVSKLRGNVFITQMFAATSSWLWPSPSSQLIHIGWRQLEGMQIHRL